MKSLKLLPALFIFFLFSSNISANENRELIDNTIKSRLQVDSAQTRDKSNQVLCAAVGKEFANKLNKGSVESYGSENELNCIPTDEFATYSSAYDDNLSFLEYLIYLSIIIWTIFYLYQKSVGLTENQSKLPSPAVYFVSLAFVFMMLVPTFKTTINGVDTKVSLINNIVANGFKQMTVKANALLSEYIKDRPHSFAEITMPHLDTKADVMEAIFDFLLSASATNKNKDINLVAVEREGNIVIEAFSGQYVGFFILGYDGSAVEIAKENGFLDYRTHTIEKQKLAIEKSLTYLQSTVENFGSSINKTSDKTTFRLRDYDCSVLPTMNLTGFTKVSLSALYTKKAAMCASEIYLTELYRYKGFEQKEYLNNQNYLSNRKLELCVHSTAGKNKFSYDQAKGKAKQCLEEACSASGGLYFCSAAIRMNEYFKKTKSEDLTDIFEFYKYYFLDNGINFSKNGEVFGNKLYFEYVKLDNDAIINTAANSLFKITLKTTGKAQFVENTFLEKLGEIAADIVNEVVGINFGSISVENLTATLFTFGSDGFLGTDRLKTCLKYPNQYLTENKYNCKGNLAEIIQNGRLVSTTAVQGFAFKFFLNFKTGKTKEIKVGEITGIKEASTKLLGSKIARTVAFITGQSYANDIHNPALKDAESQLENVAIYSAIYFSESLKGFVDKILWTLFIFGFVAYYVIPMTIIYYSFKSISDVIINLVVFLKTSTIQVINSFLSSKHKAPNLDLPDWLVYAIMIILSPIVLFISFTIVDNFLNYGFSYLPDNFLNIISGTFEVKGGIYALEEYLVGMGVLLIFLGVFFKILISATTNISIYANLFTFNQGTVDYSNDSALQDNIENDRISNKFWSK